MPQKLPTLEQVVDRVVGNYLLTSRLPQQISVGAVRQMLHVNVHAQYFQLGRKDTFAYGTIKKKVKSYLLRNYLYIEERENDPLRPGRSIIIGAHYERRR